MEQEERMGRQQIRSVAYIVGAVSLMNSAKSIPWWRTTVAVVAVIVLAEVLARSPLAKFMGWMPKGLKRK